MSALELMSWNIREGGDARLDAIVAFMRANKPDCVALLEADSLPNAEALASELGMTLTNGAANCPSAVAWLTAQTPVEAENHRLPQLAKTLMRSSGKSLFGYGHTPWTPCGRSWTGSLAWS
jgi:hypothetical protein